VVKASASVRQVRPLDRVDGEHRHPHVGRVATVTVSLGRTPRGSLTAVVFGQTWLDRLGSNRVAPRAIHDDGVERGPDPPLPLCGAERAQRAEKMAP
jgi:hypothetical protein